MSADAARPGTRLREILPLYGVVFVGFLGYAAMIAVFTPMLIRNDGGMLAASSSTSERTIVLGVLLCMYPLGQFLGSPVLGALSDRVGREWVWTVGCLGFAVCYAALLLLGTTPSSTLLWTMVIAQGFLGYGMTSVVGAIPAEIFQGRHYGGIFGTLMGVLTIGVLRNGLNLVGTSPFVQQIVIGVVIVLAVMVDANKRRSR